MNVNRLEGEAEFIRSTAGGSEPRRLTDTVLRAAHALQRTQGKLRFALLFGLPLQREAVTFLGRFQIPVELPDVERGLRRGDQKGAAILAYRQSGEGRLWSSRTLAQLPARRFYTRTVRSRLAEKPQRSSAVMKTATRV